MDILAEALALHEKYRGKISVESKVPVTNNHDLSLAYTPGVAEPCKKIVENPADVYKYTSKGNLVAVISDGSAVLGLGNIGPEAALPVMEGKAILFKEFAGIDTIPICLATQDTEEIITTIKNIAPGFGGINLEDISSPRCFEIEARLSGALEIPVFHDDQHGTAIVVAAGLINALKVVGKDLTTANIVLNGPGAAGFAIVTLLHHLGAANILICDEHGILASNRKEKLESHKSVLAQLTNVENVTGSLQTALKNADVFIGVSVANALSQEAIKQMNPDPIVFALANPVPEIMYQEAIAAGVKVMATGRSDFPNQINNVLAFPGIFKGALAVRAKSINLFMKKAAVNALVSLVSEEELAADYIIPAPFDPRVVECVSDYVAEAAVRSEEAQKLFK